MPGAKIAKVDGGATAGRGAKVAKTGKVGGGADATRMEGSSCVNGALPTPSPSPQTVPATGTAGDGLDELDELFEGLPSDDTCGNDPARPFGHPCVPFPDGACLYAVAGPGGCEFIVCERRPGSAQLKLWMWTEGIESGRTPVPPLSEAASELVTMIRAYDPCGPSAPGQSGPSRASAPELTGQYGPPSEPGPSGPSRASAPGSTGRRWWLGRRVSCDLHLAGLNTFEAQFAHFRRTFPSGPPTCFFGKKPDTSGLHQESVTLDLRPSVPDLLGRRTRRLILRPDDNLAIGPAPHASDLCAGLFMPGQL